MPRSPTRPLLLLLGAAAALCLQGALAFVPAGGMLARRAVRALRALEPVGPMDGMHGLC